jgi:hypothetical protein
MHNLIFKVIENTKHIENNKADEQIYLETVKV